MGRSILAIVVGFVVIGVLSLGTDAVTTTLMPQLYTNGRMESVTWLLVTQVYVFLYATFGCWLTGRLAPDRPMRHAIILGLLGLAFNLAGSAMQWATVPVWYHVLAIALVMPASYLGGLLAERRGGVTIPPRAAAI